MHQFLQRMNIDTEKSFAFGDSESDIPLLQAVAPKNSFLIGGDVRSRESAEQNEWNLLDHNENILDRVKARVDDVFADV
jgi:phosphoserine phosphatase